MKIAICDDDSVQIFQLQKLIQMYCKEKHINLTLNCFESARDILSLPEIDFDMLFIDIFMPEMNGIDAVKELRKQYSLPVVFVSSSKDFALDAFDLGAAHYLVKPLIKDKLFEAMDRCSKSIPSNAKSYIEVKSAYRTIPVTVNQIICIEVFNNLSVIHTEKTDIQTYTSLQSIYQQLDPGQFMKPHRSYIVNMAHIKHFTSDHLELDNGLSIVLSRSKRAELKQQYQDYLRDFLPHIS